MIAAYILENSEKVIHMSSRELARNTFTNSTTIVRFVKKLFTLSIYRELFSDNLYEHVLFILFILKCCL